MNESILYVDTSGFYASLARDDAHHDEALAILNRAERESLSLITANFIVAEAHALILHRLGHDAATAFLRGFEGSRIVVIRASVEDERNAHEIIYRYTDKLFSLTDAISFAVMDRLGIATAFTFDRDFERYGFAAARA